MEINLKSTHYRWGKFCHSWSIFDTPSPRTLCSYFWLWLVWGTLTPVLSGMLIPIGVVVAVAAIALVELGPLALGLWWLIDPYYYFSEKVGEEFVRTGETLYVGYWVWAPAFTIQAIIWLTTYSLIMKETFRKQPFPEPVASTADVVGEYFRSVKRKVCPLIEYKE